MLLSGPSRNHFMEKFLSQNAYCETKSFTESVTKYLMKFEKEIDAYFLNLGKDGFAYRTLEIPFTANTQMLQTRTGTHEKLVKLQYDDFAHDVYSEK